jgi:hypothetical protein
MDFIRRMQAKDWTIAFVAFVAGAIIFSETPSVPSVGASKGARP